MINKAWLVTLIAYIGGVVGKYYGVTFPEEIYNEVANFIWVVILPLIGFYLSRTKTVKEVTPDVQLTKPTFPVEVNK